MVLLGCKTAPMTNTIVSQAEIPNGQSSALIVERYYQAALNANQFYLLVLSKEQDPKKAIEDKSIGDLSALIATKASRIVLRWDGSETLLVICNSCGIQAIDVNKKLDHIGSTKIVYQGFPEHTAYS
jgi:hypothetical protein